MAEPVDKPSVLILGGEWTLDACVRVASMRSISIENSTDCRVSVLIIACIVHSDTAYTQWLSVHSYSYCTALYTAGVGFIGRHLTALLVQEKLASKIRVVDKAPPSTGWLNSQHKVQHTYMCVHANTHTHTHEYTNDFLYILILIVVFTQVPNIVGTCVY